MPYGDLPPATETHYRTGPVGAAYEISYRPLRGRFDEGPSKGPAVS